MNRGTESFPRNHRLCHLRVTAPTSSPAVIRPARADTLQPEKMFNAVTRPKGALPSARHDRNRNSTWIGGRLSSVSTSQNVLLPACGSSLQLGHRSEGARVRCCCFFKPLFNQVRPTESQNIND